MANAKRDRKKVVETILLVILVVLMLWAKVEVFPDEAETPQSSSQGTAEQDGGSQSSIQGTMQLHMIECGQADSFLFIQGEDTALIDCGTRSTGKDVIKYIKDLGITQLDYVIGTHPHDDHMGGMYDVITNFEVEAIVMPKIKNGDVTANWYGTLMEEIVEKEYNLKYAAQDATYKVGEASMDVIGLLSDYEGELNNSSIVMKVSFGEIDIIMTGDAEKEVERHILELGKDIEAEILKVGHHGSNTSTSDEFLDAINPNYALISCKVGNKHEHPKEETMKKLEERNIPVYRTDECGSVVVTITSNSVSFSTEPGDYRSGIELEEKVA